MKRFLIVLVMLALGTMLFSGCSGNGVTPPPPNAEPSVEVLQLIKEYSCSSNEVWRWPNGVVSVCDATGETKAIWEEINTIIDGPVSFQLTDDTAAAIGIEYQPVEGMFFIGFPEMSNNVFMRCGVLINPATVSEDVYLRAVIAAAGIRIQKCDEGFSENIKTVLYWLYRLEPGFPL